MKLGLFTPVLGKLTFKAMLAKVRELEKVTAIELGTGGWPGHDHIDVDALLDNKACIAEYRTRIDDAGLTISALSCHGNPLHPDRATAQITARNLSGCWVSAAPTSRPQLLPPAIASFSALV